MVNRLAASTSLYLRQHQSNPVDWWEWGSQALEEARRRDVPIFLSIGYSACHWCHVMEEESFENNVIAQALNDATVPIKVDREERPDVDAMYLEAVQATTGGGGWPMSIFATPDGKPFFAGTYFPPNSRSGMVGLTQIIDAVRDAWQNRREEIEAEAENIATAIRNRTTLPPSQISPPNINTASLLGEVKASLTDRFDPQWGGFGKAPKFPQPHLIESILAIATLTKDSEILSIATQTLDAMARGGIFDHLGGGFARYSTDRFWMVPHFEKMLYDQAGLLRVYAIAFAITHNESYRYVARRIVSYTLGVLGEPSGKLAASQDADSEGEEGAYYLFRKEEIEELLGDEAEKLIAFFGVTKAGNFEGRNILHRPLGGSIDGSPEIHALAERLLAYRKTRVEPGVDTKSVLEWSADFVSALYLGGRLCDESDWIVAADKSLAFLRAHHLSPGGLLRRSLGASGETFATSADYLALIEACLHSYEAHGSKELVDLAITLAERVIEEYFDRQQGGFFTSDQSPSVVLRIKDVFDGATRSTNARAADTLLRLGTLLGRKDLLDASNQTLAYVSEALVSQPGAFAPLSITSHLAKVGLQELVIPGHQSKELVKVAWSLYLPDVILAFGDRLPGGLFEDREDTLAYLCRNRSCQLPTNDPDALQSQLGGSQLIAQTQPGKIDQ